jgi:hypothetical protein
MKRRSPGSVQLRLHLPSENQVALAAATRHEIVQILAQLLASAVATATPTPEPETRDETR